MNEQDVRALVREAIERHLGRPGGASRSGSSTPAATARSGEHPSHILLRVLPGSHEGDGACVIEPAVRCNHCGFCQSYGH